ncbi:unnamed protein product [Alopecurus aequalis]
MAKLAFFVVVLVALMALSAAKRDSTLQLQLQCQRELQESSLDACRQVVDHQLAVQLPFFLPRSSQLRTGVRAQCCQQLRDISRECHTAAVRQIVRQYEHQAMVPLREYPYYPGEDEEQQGGSYYPGEPYPQQEQGWEQKQGQGHQAFPHQQEPWWRQQQQGQGSYQTYRPQQEQGSYRPSQTYHPQQHQQGPYHPSQTYPQQQEQGSYRPSQTYRPQQQGSYRPSQTYYPQQHQQGLYHPSQTFPHQQQEGGFCGQSTAQQQHQQGRQEPYGLRITIYHHARQPAQHELSETAQQQATRLRMQLKVVARARQVAAQLPAMCMLEGRVFSAGHY